MNTNEQQEVKSNTTTHQLTYRFRGEKEVNHIQGTMAEMVEFLDDFNWTSTYQVLTNFGKKYSNNNKRNQQALGLFPERIQVLPTSPIEWHFIFPIQDTVEIEKYARIKGDKPKENNGEIKTHKGVKGIYPGPLELNTHTVTICELTGIAWAAELPSPLFTGLKQPHPFSHFHNVREMITRYQNHGIKIEKLGKVVISGMIITSLRHMGLVGKVNGIKANDRLSKGSIAVLIRFLNHILSAASVKSYPMINLESDGSIDERLLAYIAIVTGQDTTVKSLHAPQKKENRVKVKVYQTYGALEAAHIEEEKAEAKEILGRLKKNYSGVNKDTFKEIENAINSVMLMGLEHREKMADKITNTFGPRSVEAHDLALIFTGIANDRLTKEVESFGQQIEAERNEFVEEKKKINLLELMKKQAKKGKE